MFHFGMLVGEYPGSLWANAALETATRNLGVEDEDGAACREQKQPPQWKDRVSNIFHVHPKPAMLLCVLRDRHAVSSTQEQGTRGRHCHHPSITVGSHCCWVRDGISQSPLHGEEPVTQVVPLNP